MPQIVKQRNKVTENSFETNFGDFLFKSISVESRSQYIGLCDCLCYIYVCQNFFDMVFVITDLVDIMNFELVGAAV